MTQTLDTHILDPIPFEPDIPALFRRLHVKEGSPNAAELSCLLDEARALARPRAFYRAAYINARGEDWVDVEGTHFNSRVLAINLTKAYRVFPYLATCGQELQVWAAGIKDMLLNYWAEAIKESAVHCAIAALNADLEMRYHPGKTATMNPGSLKDWPIQQQALLFQLFCGGQDRIGVRLTDSMLMLPTKSVSGIRFPTDDAFESCQLCPREDCPGRRAPYEPALFDERYSAA